jgi:electron transport complex protein RnfB
MSAKNPVKALHDLLPKTQCRECGYPDCESYAKALTHDEKNIGLCAPGGIPTLKNIADLLKRDPAPYFKEVEERIRPPATVVIREEECIGCKKCIQACPVDAIIGTAKHMHTVLSDECTGCGLCIEPCPVDCIDLIPLDTPAYNPLKAQERYDARQIRLKQEAQEAQRIQPENMQSILARIKK